MNKPLLIALACLFASCGVPNHVKFKLDITTFNTKQVNDTVHSSLKKDIEVTLIRLPDGSYKQWSKKAGYSIIIYRYFYPTGQLKSWVKSAWGFNFDVSPTYDRNGKLESEINYDKLYKITVNKLDFKMATKFGVNIFKEDVRVFRIINSEPPTYKLTIPVIVNGKKGKLYIDIDANTGEIISNVFHEDSN